MVRLGRRRLISVHHPTARKAERSGTFDTTNLASAHINQLSERKGLDVHNIHKASQLVTRGSGGEGFNNTSFKGAARKERWPVLTPELWNPIAQEWRNMAPEGFNRCYHSTALLLPTGQVLSANGGEWIADDTKGCNKQEDTLPVQRPKSARHPALRLKRPGQR